MARAGYRGWRSSCLSCDAGGCIWLAVATDPQGGATAWFDPRHEIVCLVLDEDSHIVGKSQVSQTDPSAAHWLLALEPWDWAGACRADSVPWMLHTAGLNAGGIGSDSRNAVRTRVYLGTCEEDL